MKKIVLIVSAMLITVTTVSAQSGFGVMGGVNSSTSSAKGMDWRVGGFVGGLYDLKVNDWFYLQPRLVFAYQENQRPVKNVLTAPGTTIGNEFRSQWNVTLPILASFRFGLSDNTALRLNAGPYIQCAMFGSEKKVIGYNPTPGTPDGPAKVAPKETWDYAIGDRITYGAQVGVQYEHGRFFGTFDYKHAFNRSILNMDGFENTLQLGVGYKF